MEAEYIGQVAPLEELIQSDLSGLDQQQQEENRERAYWEAWQNFRYLYGASAVPEFNDFIQWADAAIKEKNA